MIDRLLESAQRYRRISEQLEDPAVHAQPGRLAALMRELGRLRPRAELHARWEALAAQRSAATAALSERDPELTAMARQELHELDLREEELHAELRRQVADEDPDRGRNVLLELRAGTGGDEAGLFVGDLLRLYSRFAEQEGLAIELLTCHPGEAGGYREAVLCISGERAWDLFRFEGGGHRVQRVPETEAQGRIHTSAATVAVLPEAEESELEIRDSDLRIDTFRSSGPGGQSVNKTSSAIRITHLPSGTVVQCQDESSQHKNKARALRLLRSRLREAAESARKAGEDTARRTQIGSGDRSERIRTYNWPQNRVTDHRTKTSYSLESVVLGRLGEIVEDLRRRDLDQKLAALGEGAS